MNAPFPVERRRALYVLGALVVLVGLGGLLAARDLGLTDAPGAIVVDVADDFLWGRQFAFNPLGALVTVCIGALVLAVAATRSRPAGLALAAATAAVAGITLVQLGADDQLFGARAGNVALLLAVVVTLVGITATPDAQDSSSADPSAQATREQP